MNHILAAIIYLLLAAVILFCLGFIGSQLPLLPPVKNRARQWLLALAAFTLGALRIIIPLLVYLIYGVTILAGLLWSWLRSRFTFYVSRLTFYLTVHTDCCACKKRIHRAWFPRPVKTGGIETAPISHSYCKPCLQSWMDQLAALPSGKAIEARFNIIQNEHATRRKILRRVEPLFRVNSETH